MANFEDKKHVNINDVSLLDVNPRYTDFSTINWKRIYDEGNSLNQEQVALNLLSYEDDYRDFIELLNSIYSDGYDNAQDRIILLETSKKELLILEGNRRMLAFKMIINIDWAKYILNQLITPEDERTYVSYLPNQEDPSLDMADPVSKNASWLKLYNKIKEISENITIEQIDSLVSKDIDNITYSSGFEDEKVIASINKSIFGRSVSAPGGKRSWSRYQTLSNTWNIYKNFVSEKMKETPALSQSAIFSQSEEKTAKFLFKSKSSIKKEIESAKLVNIFIKDYNIQSNEEIDWKKEMVSAIELSINEIKIDHIIPEFKNFKSMFSITIGQGNDLNFEKFTVPDKFKNITRQSFSFFIVDSFLNGLYSTRGWKDKKSEKTLYAFLMQEYNENSLFSTILGGDDLESIDLIKSINNKAKQINAFYNEFVKNEIFNPKIFTKQEAKDSPTYVIAIYMKHILSQDIKNLLKNFGEKTFETYPYFSLSAIARNFIELSRIYIFTDESDLREEIFSTLNEDEKTEYKRIFKVENSEDFLIDSQIRTLLFHDEVVRAPEGINKNLNMKINRLFTLEKPKGIIDNYSFKKENQNTIKIFGINNSFIWRLNKTIHTPYWLLHEDNFLEIANLMQECTDVIKETIRFFNLEEKDISKIEIDESIND